MIDRLEYQDYIGSVHYSARDEVFFGKLEGVSDLITFEGASVKELKKAFIEAIKDYQRLCEVTGKNSVKSFKGTFNVRLSPETHRKAYRKALKEGKTLNQLVKEAVEKELANEGS
ncbi:MAG TPA: type II toxin-antitoxin system HicB family antitoxin [Saprospiraceae bacterium]|nr:type II toxin-antitoxin system HicB family antitoxin [Saprospiraceae bacterium]